MQIAKIFQSGGSQAVRIPAEFRFDATQVYIRRIESTGEVVLSTRPRKAWSDFMSQRARLAKSAELRDFMRDREQPATQNRDPLEGLDDGGDASKA